MAIVDGIRRRVTFKRRIATESLILVILLWYLFQIATLYLGWGAEMIQWFFTTESFPALSPGLFLSIISHDFPPNVTHVLGNIAFLWLFAGESEQHMDRLEVISFFVVTALAAVIVGTATSGTNTLGASGGAFAFIGFYCIHLPLEHREEFDLKVSEYGAFSYEKLRAHWQVCLLLTPAVLFSALVGQQIGLLPAGRADVVGHLTGFLCGVGYAALRSLGENLASSEELITDD
jgi:membrane associated rhomboid family serine protease